MRSAECRPPRCVPPTQPLHQAERQREATLRRDTGHDKIKRQRGRRARPRTLQRAVGLGLTRLSAPFFGVARGGLRRSRNESLSSSLYTNTPSEPTCGYRCAVVRTLRPGLSPEPASTSSSQSENTREAQKVGDQRSRFSLPTTVPVARQRCTLRVPVNTAVDFATWMTRVAVAASFFPGGGLCVTTRQRARICNSRRCTHGTSRLSSQRRGPGWSAGGN